MIRRAKTFDSVLGIIIPLERTYTRPPRTAVSRTVPSFRMKGATFPHEFQARQLPPARVGAAIIDVCEFRAETANINWKFWQQSLAAKLMEHREDLLCLPSANTGYQHARIPLESGDKRFRQTFLFTGASPALGLRVITACAFQDQHINFLLGENCLPA